MLKRFFDKLNEFENSKIIEKPQENSDEIKKKELMNILKVAKYIVKNTSSYEYNHPIFLIVKQLIEIELYSQIYNVISNLDSSKVKSFSNYDFLPNNEYVKGRNNLYKNRDLYLYEDFEGNKVTYQKFENSITKKANVSINLGQDPVLTYPWNVTRLARAYSKIGSGKEYGNWIQDDNHRAYLIMPVGITIVEGGNHSITTGIMNNEGTIEFDYIFDYNDIYDYIYCDGVNYIRIKDNSIYSPVKDFRFSIIFEIGRIIKENGIKFKEINL